MLYSGLGVDRVSRILSLRKASLGCWKRLYSGEGVDFEMLFQDTLAIFDSSPDEFIFERFQDELIGQMKRPLGLRYDQILLRDHQRAAGTTPRHSGRPAHTCRAT